MADSVLVSRLDNGVVDIKLNRPDKLNAINTDLMEGLKSVANALIDDISARVVVLSDNGKGFCSGLDMDSFSDMLSGDLSGDSENVEASFSNLSSSGANQAQQLAWVWQELPIPVIAAVHGAALGGGLNLALGADIRVLAPDAKLGFVEINWGLFPDMSATQSLRRLVSLERAKELVFTGRKFSGEQALEYGLATYLDENPHSKALELAGIIAQKNPGAIRGVKQVLNQAALVPLAQGLKMEGETSRKLIGTANQIESIMAQMENRPPVFTHEK